MKMRVGTKIVLGISLVVALLLIMGVHSIISSRSIGKDVGSIDSLNGSLSLQKDIQIHFQSSVAGIRGYIAYGRDSFAESYTNEMNLVLESEKKLLGTISDDKKPEAQQLIALTTAYHKEISGELIPAVKRQFQAPDMKTMEAEQKEVQRIAGTLVPITGQLTEIVSGLVTDTQKRFNNSIDTAESSISGIIKTILMISLAAFVLALAVSYFLSRSIKVPIGAMVSGANRYAAGDFSTGIRITSSDEIGDLAASLNTMAVQLREVIGEVITGSQTLAAQSQELAASAEEVNATVEEVASTTSQVAATAEKSMENAARTASESQRVVEVAQSGGEVVRHTIQKISAIAQSATRVNESIQDLGNLSVKIGNITDVITGIAEQTNLLALNAAIEAARAGEQGRGFAVVAEEVRQLAEQSAGAAREIGQLINQIRSGVDTAIKSMEQGVDDVSEGVHLASEAGVALDGIIQAINQNIALIEDITLGARQTSTGTQQLMASNEQVTSTIQQVAGATQELSDIAGKLQMAVDRFKV